MLTDRFNHTIQDGVRVRFVAGRPARVRFGTVESLSKDTGTFIVREEGTNRPYGLTYMDVQVCPIEKRPDGTYLFAEDT